MSFHNGAAGTAMSLVTRAVLTGQPGLDNASRSLNYSTNVTVNLVCCSLSLVGSLVMIVPFCFSNSLRKIRHKIILGLGVNDFLQAVTVLVPSVYTNFGQRRLPTNSPGCVADSFFYLTLVVSGCLWVLAIAMVTYVTLVHPLSTLARWLHYPSAMPTIWVIIALVSLLNASFGAALVPSIDFGGFCFFSSRPPALYGNLIIFLPRTALFIAVIVLYVKLALFFRRQSGRAKKTESGLEMTCSPGAPGQPMLFPLVEQPTSAMSPSGRGTPIPHANAGDFTSNATKTSDIPGHRIYEVASLRHQLADYRMSKGDSIEEGKENGEPRKASKDSQSTLVEGSSVQFRRPDFLRRGSSKPDMASVKEEAPASGPRTARETNSPSLIMQDSEAILSGDAGFEHQLVLLEATVSSSPRIPLTARALPSLSPAPSSQNEPSSTRTPCVGIETSSSIDLALPHAGLSTAYRFPALRSTSATDTIITPFSTDSSSPLFRSASARTAFISDDSSVAIGPSLSYAFPQTVPVLSGSTLEGVPPLDGPPRPAWNSPSRDDPVSKPHRQQSGELSLAKSKTGGQASSRSSSSDDGPNGMGFWEALANVDPRGEGETGAGEPYVDRGRRMSASEENRRVAYLMMLYPMAYAAIVAVSLARTLSTMVTGLPPNPTLAMMNRIFVLSTGCIDAIIYTIVEWRFRAASRAAASKPRASVSL